VPVKDKVGKALKKGSWDITVQTGEIPMLSHTPASTDPAVKHNALVPQGQ
jgi:hypothetical protein